MIPLDSSSAAVAPSTGQVEIVGRLASNVLLTHVVLRIELINDFGSMAVPPWEFDCLEDRNSYIKLFW
jgi:hypothetical protein